MADSPSPALPADQPHVERREERYELRVGDELLSFADYSERDGVVSVPHVETIPHHRRKGYSSLLMAGVVDDLRRRSVRIHPTCAVARTYVEALPDADSLLAR